MKKVLARFLVLLFLPIVGASALAANAPVDVTHRLTGYNIGTNTVTATYAVHVVNPGPGTLTTITLTAVRMPPFTEGRATFNVSSLAANQGADFSMQLEAPATIGQTTLEKTPLFFAGKCIDSQGNSVEFPVKSSPGGMQ